MSQKKQKYYVVWKGHKPGIYNDWNKTLEQLKGFSAPVFKAFLRLDIATKALNDNPEKYLHADYIELPLFHFNDDKPKVKASDYPSIKALTVDAACSGNPGVMEYRGVDLETGNEVFKQGPFPMGTNNIGEFLALAHGLALLHKNGDERPVFSDSETAIGWIWKKQARTKLERNDKTQSLFDLIERAEKWLQTHHWKNKIIKWDTESWGEIPADFGRK
jgi:ribonuclease HI